MRSRPQIEAGALSGSRESWLCGQAFPTIFRGSLPPVKPDVRSCP